MKSITMRKGVIFMGIAIIIVLVLVIGASLWLRHEIERQNGPGQNYSKTEIVELSKPTDPKTVVFETERVTIGFGLKNFTENLEQFIEANPHMTVDKDLLNFIKEQAIKTDTININDMEDGGKYQAQYRIADLLEGGEYTLFDKKENLYQTQIKVTTSGFTCGPLCGRGGRIFKLMGDDTVFLSVMDWIS